MLTLMRIRLAERLDATRMAAIYNQGIEDRSSTFATTPVDTSDMFDRINAVERYPVVVMVDVANQVVGWAGLSSYRDRACYEGVADFSIYLDRGVRGYGFGKQLLKVLLEEAEARGFWKILSRIFTVNHAGLALCEACGFRQVGVYEKHACLEGRWLDCTIVERLFPVNQPV